MPTYNVAPYVAEAVNSILGQTWRELELVIQDDGSKDNTVEVLRGLAEGDPRIRLLPPFSANRGVIAARNALLENARGDFIAWMDGDDISKPERIRHQVEFLLAHPDMGALGTAIQRIDAKGAPLDVQKFPREPERQAVYLDICCASVLARRAAVKDAGLFRSAFSEGGEDGDWLLKMADRHKITNTDAILYLYRQTGGLFSRNRPVIDRLGVLARHAALARRRGEPDPIDSLTPDSGHHYVRDELFLNNPRMTREDKLEALGRTLPGHRPLVSVLIPFFNDDLYFFEKYLTQLSRQTFRNFEIVIYDDGSQTPLNEEQVRRMIPGVAVTLIASHEHRGADFARSEIVKHARGAIVIWQNDEVHRGDWVRPEEDMSVRKRRAFSLQEYVAARL